MLSYAHGADDRPLIGKTIGDFFDAISESHADHEALVSCHQGIRWTYGELRERVDELARALISLGIHKGDRVGIWSPNHAEWVVTQFATAKIGAILVNVNPAYRVHELEYALRQSGCATLIIAPPFKTSDYAALLRELCPGAGALAAGRTARRKGAGASDSDHLRGAASTGRLRVGRGNGARHRGSGGGASESAGEPSVRRPDQHPVHLGHDRLSQGCDALPPLDRQQRLLLRRVHAHRQPRPLLRDVPVLPLRRYGPEHPPQRDPRGDRGDPVAPLRRRDDPRSGRVGAMHGLARARQRCSSPS